MEPQDELVTKGGDAKRTKRTSREQRNKRRHELNKRVKIKKNEVKGKVRFEDVEVIDETEKQEKLKKEKEPVQLRRVAEKKDRAKQVDMKIFQVESGYDTEMDKKMGAEDATSVKKKLPPIIGVFKDAKRRIDYVMVMEDDRIPLMQEIRIDFLTNILKTGLELEFENGVLKKHQHLIFIKVHAPDKVLQAFDDTFGVKKYFKAEHLEFIKTDYSLMDWFFTYRHEREWLKIVRRQYIKPLKYSNLDRSYIVFMMLQHLRFGKPNNYYSLARLIQNQIVTDGYALHDGPYFFHPKQQSAHINGRQILFYNWVGSLNIFTFQPINMINEYLGPKIAFYFAFYEFYNKAIIIPMVVGTFIFCNQYIDFRTKTIDWTLPYPENKIKFESDFVCKPIGQKKKEYDDYYICPKCRDFSTCPFLKLKDYCSSVYYKSFLDNEITIYHIFILCSLVILFVRLWKRTESYWIWMWELGLPPKRTTVRSEYFTPYRNPVRSESTGLWAHHDDAMTNKWRHFVANVWMFLCALGVILFTTLLIMFNNYLIKSNGDSMIKKKRHPEYVILPVIAILGVIGASFFGKICWNIAHTQTERENHRTQENFESSHILKVFGISFAFTFPMLLYLALIKGSFYVTPLENFSPTVNFTFSIFKIPFKFSKHLDWLGDLFISNCGHYAGCWDEVAWYYTVTMLFKVVSTQFFNFTACLPTDYSKGLKINMTVPTWEREYMLESVTEAQLVLKMNGIMIQLSLLALFGFTNMLMLILVFLNNIWDIRNDAKVILVCSRRALLHRCAGIGTWNYVLYFIIYASAITMSVIVVRSSTSVDRFVDDYLTNYELPENFNKTAELPALLLKKRFVEFKTANYDDDKAAKKLVEKYKKTKPTICHFGGSVIEKPQDPENQNQWPYSLLNIDYKGKLRLTERVNKKRILKGIVFLTFIHMIAIVFLVTQYYVPPVLQATQEVMEKERNLLRMHFEHIKVNKKHRVDLVVD